MRQPRNAVGFARARRVLDQVTTRPSARAASVSPITVSHWCKRGTASSGCGSFPGHRVDVVGDLQCRNRPRVSSQVSRCLPGLARQLRLDPLGQPLRRRIRHPPHTFFSK